MFTSVSKIPCMSDARDMLNSELDAPLQADSALAKARRIRVLIIDDSVAMSHFIEKALEGDPRLQVVGYALDPYQARDMIKQLRPDVLTLDVEMPRMDGLTFLRNLMRLRPMPVVMLSSLTDAGTAVTLDAMEAGAVDFMVKQHPRNRAERDAYTQEICQRVRQAGEVRLPAPSPLSSQVLLPAIATCQQKLKTGVRPGNGVMRIVAFGSSTGGPQALLQILGAFKAPDTALVICQHMPEHFMAPFAERLNRVCDHQIRLAQDGDLLEAGVGYVAPGDCHLELQAGSLGLRWSVTASERICEHRPSVGVLFDSISQSAARGCVGVLLTGMGNDGAAGLAALREAGALTIIQDKDSSAVWGMPGHAHRLGGADAVFSLEQIGPALTQLLSR